MNRVVDVLRWVDEEVDVWIPRVRRTSNDSSMAVLEDVRGGFYEDMERMLNLCKQTRVTYQC